MVFNQKIDKRNLLPLIDEAEKGPVTVTVESGGGDFLAALTFVEIIQQRSLMHRFTFEIIAAHSAAAFVILQLKGSKRILLRGGEITVHGGRTSCANTDLFETSLLRKIQEFYNLLKADLKDILSQDRLNDFVDTNQLTLTREECVRAGITVDH